MRSWPATRPFAWCRPLSAWPRAGARGRPSCGRRAAPSPRRRHFWHEHGSRQVGRSQGSAAAEESFREHLARNARTVHWCWSQRTFAAATEGARVGRGQALYMTKSKVCRHTSLKSEASRKSRAEWHIISCLLVLICCWRGGWRACPFQELDNGNLVSGATAELHKCPKLKGMRISVKPGYYKETEQVLGKTFGMCYPHRQD